MRTILAVACSLLALSACSDIPLSAHSNRGGPESLLDMSSEAVTVSLNSPSAVTELVNWVNNDQPSRADLYCQGGMICTKAEQALAQFGVPTNRIDSADNVVILSYERLQARDCDNRYIDNSINPYNLNHPTFGCSTAANMVQMVGDKRQFTNPTLLDFMGGDKAAQVYTNYMKPPADQALSSSSLLSGSTQ